MSVAFSFYDPLGGIPPVAARIKVVFQLLCRNKPDWDDEASDDFKLTWFELLRTLRDLNTVKLKRYAYSDAAPSRFFLQFYPHSILLVCGPKGSCHCTYWFA